MVPAILMMEKTHFEVTDYPHFAQSCLGQIEALGQNDVYHWLKAWIAQRDDVATQPDLKMTLICPANEGHVKKYTKQEFKLHRETPEIYEKVVKPYQTSLPLTKIAWVYNILDHLKEVENIIYEDPDEATGFVILPDLYVTFRSKIGLTVTSKWDQKTMSSLYLTAIVRRRDLKCIRDLRSSELPLLKKMRRSALMEVSSRYKVEPNQLRLFFHYQPTFCTSFHLSVSADVARPFASSYCAH